MFQLFNLLDPLFKKQYFTKVTTENQTFDVSSNNILEAGGRMCEAESGGGS